MIGHAAFIEIRAEFHDASVVAAPVSGSSLRALSSMAIMVAMRGAGGEFSHHQERLHTWKETAENQKRMGELER